jgi:hypothetical protein
MLNQAFDYQFSCIGVVLIAFGMQYHFIELAHIITSAMIKSIFNAAKVKVFSCFAVLLAASEK